MLPTLLPQACVGVKVAMFGVRARVHPIIRVAGVFDFSVIAVILLRHRLRAVERLLHSQANTIQSAGVRTISNSGSHGSFTCTSAYVACHVSVVHVGCVRGYMQEEFLI